jgi:hypothetical protein
VAVFGTVFLGILALVVGIPMLIFGSWEYAVGSVALIAFCWLIWLLIWLLMCGLYRLVGGPE